MRRPALIQHPAEGSVPVDILSGLLGPEALVILLRLLLERSEIVGFDTRLARKIGRRLKQTVFDQYGIDFITGHGWLPDCLADARAYTAGQPCCKLCEPRVVVLFIVVS